MALIKVGQGWQFETESDLEEEVWHNLPELLTLRPLRRQFSIDGKFCDILATGPSRQLVVIELKNKEDRYVIQQLTRYYNALRTLQLSKLNVDYEQSIRLVAIAPSFHTDTLIDCKYSTLAIELITFTVEAVADGYQLTLKDISNNIVSQLLLPKSLKAAETDIHIADPPRKLLNWLSQRSEAEHDGALQLRRQLLSFDARMKEYVEPKRIIYGRNKSKICCTLRKSGDHGYFNQSLDYFLWLPNLTNKKRVLRMIVGFNFSKDTVTGLIYCPKSYQVESRPWEFPRCVEIMQGLNWRSSFEKYAPFLNADQTISPSNLTNLALETWCHRL